MTENLMGISNWVMANVYRELERDEIPREMKLEIIAALVDVKQAIDKQLALLIQEANHTYDIRLKGDDEPTEVR